MPNEIEAKWQIYPEDGGFQLHKLNPDGARGEAVGPKYSKRSDALKYQRALYSNSPDTTASEKEPETTDMTTLADEIRASSPEYRIKAVPLSGTSVPVETHGYPPGGVVGQLPTAIKARDLPIREETRIGVSAGVEMDVTAPTSTMNLITGTVHFVADVDNPRFLRFKDAVLARAETNLNGDDISPQGVKELAETIDGTPIDLDHSLIKNIGVYTAGRVGNNNDLLVDGIIWLDRCEALNIDVNDIINGKFKLSVEASAETAECSYCHGIYRDSKAYCEHLIKKAKFHAKRLLRKLQAVGGAITYNPAGTNTGFANGLVFVASHQIDEESDDLFMKNLVSQICDQYKTSGLTV